MTVVTWGNAAQALYGVIDLEFSRDRTPEELIATWRDNRFPPPTVEQLQPIYDQLVAAEQSAQSQYSAYMQDLQSIWQALVTTSDAEMVGALNNSLALLQQAAGKLASAETARQEDDLSNALATVISAMTDMNTALGLQYGVAVAGIQLIGDLGRITREQLRRVAPELLSEPNAL